MYKKEELKITSPPCYTYKPGEGCDDDWDDEGHTHSVGDSRDSGDYRIENAAYLPHSCNEWVIGGPMEIRSLIEDLQIALQKLTEQV